MPVEMLTYAELGERLKISPEAARALVKRHRWPRSRSNDGKTLVQVDLSRNQPFPNHPSAASSGRSPGGHRPKQHIETLQAELAEMKLSPAAIGATSREMRTHQQAVGRTA